MRSVCLVLALFAALGVGSLRPWLLSHCPPADQALACAQNDCCPLTPDPTAPDPATPPPADCTFCVAVVVAPQDLLPSDLIAAPAAQPTAVTLHLLAYRCVPPPVPVTVPPPAIQTRHVVLLI